MHCKARMGVVGLGLALFNSTACGGVKDGGVTVAQLVPLGARVHRTCSSDVEAEGRRFAFVHVYYGEPQDCVVGCIFSQLDSVEEGGLAVLTSAEWFSENERPQGVSPCTIGRVPGCAEPASLDPLVVKWSHEPRARCERPF